MVTLTGTAAGDDLPEPPLLSAAQALFLDFDGTLVDIAPTPDAVVVAPGVAARLSALVLRLAGAVAVISGRPIAEIDRYLPLHLPCAGLHGWERRGAQGLCRAPSMPGGPHRALHVRLAHFACRHPGVLVEAKRAGFALHYRKAPQHAEACGAIMARLAGRCPDLRLQAGHCVLELVPADADKGRAVMAFLREAPFRGRAPVYLGDDVTDEDAFRAVRAAGGMAVAIGARPDTAAAFTLPSPAAVQDWLGRSLDRLQQARVAAA